MYWKCGFIVIIFIGFPSCFGSDIDEGDDAAVTSNPSARHSGCFERIGNVIRPCQPQPVPYVIARPAPATVDSAATDVQRLIRQLWTIIFWRNYSRRVQNSGASTTAAGNGDGDGDSVGEWGEWTRQGTCSSTCRDETGLQRYTRQCVGGSKCTGNDERFGFCTATVACPVINCRDFGIDDAFTVTECVSPYSPGDACQITCTGDEAPSQEVTCGEDGEFEPEPSCDEP